jgi:hypothetical protein
MLRVMNTEQPQLPIQLIRAGMVVLATGLAIAGWYLPWVAFQLDGQAISYGPPTFIGAFAPPAAEPPSPPLSFTTIAVLMVLACFAISLALIFLRPTVRIDIPQVVQSLRTQSVRVWCGALVIGNLSLIALMWLALGFDDGDTSATNFHYTAGIFCALASIVMAGGYRWWVRLLEHVIQHVHLSRQQT